MVDFFKFSIDPTSVWDRDELAAYLVNRFNKNITNMQIEYRIEGEGPASYCILSVEPARYKAAFLKFPMAFYRLNRIPKDIEKNILTGSKIVPRLGEMSLNNWLCGYIKVDAVERKGGIEKFGKAINIAAIEVTRDKKQLDKTVCPYTILPNVVVINKKKCYPVVFNCSPYREGVLSNVDDYKRLLARKYRCFNEAMVKIFGDLTDTTVYKSDMCGNVMSLDKKNMAYADITPVKKATPVAKSVMGL